MLRSQFRLFSFSQLRTLALCAIILFSPLAFANPIDGVVTNGSATISQSPGYTQINQSSDKAILEWRSFNIDANEHTHFQQPTNGIALNRIDPNQGVSQIYGQLTATGKIVLVNQAGIFFGPTARVDVGGIIASTSDISNANFLAGKYIFDKPSPYNNASITNQGSIRAADYGLVALIGSNVVNSGYIQANMGTVALASGNKFTIDMMGDGLINFTVDEGTTSEHSGVKNSGRIVANGGRILMSARAAQGVVDNVINMSGVAIAKSVYERGGEIILSGDPQTAVHVSGKLIATGKRHGEKGGTVKVLGGYVHLASTAKLDVSGYGGGGKILVGGNFHGAGPELNAFNTRVDSGALLKANAIEYGDGGLVAVWSDHNTEMFGKIYAQGGAYGGNGGFVETSGEYLNVNGAHVNTLASKGDVGTWLLDPTNIWVAVDQAAATAAGMSGTDTTANTGDGGSPNTFSGGVATDSLLTTGSLEAALATSSVRVTTVSAGAGTGNLKIVSPVTWSTSNSLQLIANNILAVNAAISAPNATITYSAVSLQIGADITSNGFSTGGSSFTLTGNSTINAGSGAISVTGINGNFALSLISSNTINLGSSIGTTTPLASLSISGGGNILTFGGQIKTTGSQTYNNTMTATNGGTFTMTNSGTISFANNLTGSTSFEGVSIGFAFQGGSAGSNNFIFAGGIAAANPSNPVNVSVTGSGSNNILTLTSTGLSKTWTISGTNQGSVSGTGANSFSFSSISNLVGGTLNDSFTLSGGSISGSINGGGGSNTLTANNVNTTWNISGPSSGSMTGVSSFANIQNLVGLATINNFMFTGSGSVSSILGDSGGTNTLDFTSYSPALTAQVSSSGVANGTILDSNSNTIVAYQNINTINDNDLTAVLPNKVMTVHITGPRSGYMGDPLFFTGLQSLQGNSNTSVIFDTNASLTTASNGDTIATVNGTTITFSNIPESGFSGSINQGSDTIALGDLNYFAANVQASGNQSSDSSSTDDSTGTPTALTAAAQQAVVVAKATDKVLSDQKAQDKEQKKSEQPSCVTR